MDINTYLQFQRELYPVPGRREDPDFLASLKQDAAIYIKDPQAEVVEVYSSSATHELISFGDKDYLIWDLHLTHLWEVLNLCTFGAASSHIEPFITTQAEVMEKARTVCRQIFSVYFATKLKRKTPYTSAAFAMIADSFSTEWYMPLKGSMRVHMRNVILMQKMLMFHHEMVHLYFHRSPNVFTAFRESFEGYLKELGLLISDFEPEITTIYPEFQTDIARGLFEHSQLNFFLEELGCDFQSFIIGGLTILNSHDVRFWLPGLNDLHLASYLLTLGERMLKIGSTFWSEFAVQTGDGTNLDALQFKNGKLSLPTLDLSRPIFNVRQWNTFLALERVLTSAEKRAGLDLVSSVNSIVNAHNEIREAWSNVVLAEFHALFSKEYLAKIFARAQYLRVERGMSTAQALEMTNQILGEILGWS